LIDAVFISHRHPDHCTDLFAAFHAWTYVPEPRIGIPLYANGDVLDHMASFLGRPPSEAFGETFSLREVTGGESVTQGSIDITFYDVEHSVPALGSKWTANGRSLFYTGDTGPGDWSSGLGSIDVLLSEAALQGARTERDFIHHLNAFEAGEIARASGVERLVITHIPPYMDSTISVAEAETTFGKPVSLAVPGVQIQI
jgi:ribonuclease BN (tRNA processing enzyme)